MKQIKTLVLGIVAMDVDVWNKVGRARNDSVCKAFDESIDRDGATDEDLAVYARSEELADAVLAQVVALDVAGSWYEARERFDPAHLPFVPHMDRTDLGLSARTLKTPTRW